MRVSILYHPKSDHSRIVEQYAHDFEHLRGRVIELVSLETKEGAETAKVYDIVQYPAVLVLNDNGELMKNWEGTELPLMDEVAGYYAV